MIKPRVGASRSRNRLVTSDQSMIEGCVRVVGDYNRVLGTYERVRKEPMIISDDLAKCVQLVTRLFQRYEIGDFRHTASELRALKELAQLNVNINCEIRGQEVTPVIDWKD